MCGDSSVVENESMTTTKWGAKLGKMLERFTKTIHSWWKKKVAFPAEKNGDYVRHIFRERNEK